MGVAFVVFAIYPESPEAVEAIEAAARALQVEGVTFRDLKVEPLAFGLSVIKAGYVFDDKTAIGADTKIEDALRALPGVQNVEAAGMTLL